MGARDYWDRMLVYFGIAEEAYEEDEGWDDDQRASRASRRAAARDVAEGDDEAPARGGSRRAAPARRPAASAGARTRQPSQHVAGVGVVPPRTFNDAQQIADQFKRGNPVIVNLQATDAELAKRVIDFASGLTYGLDGSMGRIADKVFLLTPPDVDVSAEDRAAMAASGFFNQS
ncbi:MAG: cell division protein SepF [Thermoleophilia bacterium]|nr:cell division protein SepF [Thermoleophilia bacterium]